MFPLPPQLGEEGVHLEEGVEEVELQEAGDKVAVAVHPVGRIIALPMRCRGIVTEDMAASAV